MKHVNKFKNKNRTDKRERYYFRVRGQKAIPLPGKPGSDEFMTAYGLALSALEKARQGETAIAVSAAKLGKPGTIAALVPSYYRSAEWLNLASDTKEARERILKRFVHGDAKKGLRGYGNFPVAMFTEQNLIDIRDKIASLSARRSWLKAIKHLLEHAVPSLIAKNPAGKIDQVRLPKTKGHWTWTNDQIATYRQHWKLGTKQRLVFEFALETVSRRGEVVRFGPQHCYISEEGERRIRIERTHGSEDVDIPMSDALAAAIEAMPIPTAINGVVPLTYLHTERGKMRSKKALGNDFAHWVRATGLPDKCRMHGLKKGGMRQGAEAGLTTRELMGRSGHKSYAEVQRYTDAADQKKLADAGAEKLKAAAARGPKLITKRATT
ncbi:tyrosine-type recombinase/integrase [Bradyrhizobium diazoefficiens]|nr:tyrosine-type recombinase/integrase [Bradyrhizobium diazoefficiens]MBR0778559.1 tyrosine-type recombinase/integrase [Bradyrhizobium diazoefficiens]